MDIPQIAITALTTLGVYLAEGVATGIGEDLWMLLKKTFYTDREKKLLYEIEKSPTDPIVQGKVAGKLEEKLEVDKILLNQIKEILSKIPAEQKVNNQNITGNYNIGMQDINTSNVTINKHNNE